MRPVALHDEGFAVVVTDYEGLGTPGNHPYINRDSQGQAALDAARTALRLPDTDLAPDSKTVVTGYSQGGGAAAAIGELQPAYSPDVNLVGVVAGAPPSDMIDTLARVDGGVLTGAVGYGVHGIEGIYPETRAAFVRILNDEGRHMVETTAGQCVADTALTYGLHRTSKFIRSGLPLSEAVQSEPEIMRVLDSYALGTTVQLHTAEIPALAPGLVIDHAIPMITETMTGARYLKDRVLGVPAPNSCGGP